MSCKKTDAVRGYRSAEGEQNWKITKALLNSLYQKQEATSFNKTISIHSKSCKLGFEKQSISVNPWLGASPCHPNPRKKTLLTSLIPVFLHPEPVSLLHPNTCNPCLPQGRKSSPSKGPVLMHNQQDISLFTVPKITFSHSPPDNKLFLACFLPKALVALHSYSNPFQFTLHPPPSSNSLAVWQQITLHCLILISWLGSAPVRPCYPTQFPGDMNMGYSYFARQASSWCANQL